MVNKSLFSFLLILSIFALIYITREKWILNDNSSGIIEEFKEDRSEENKLTYTEGLLEGQFYSFFGTRDLASRNLSEIQVKDIILKQIAERDSKKFPNIEKNLVRTERWPYNRKWYIGEFLEVLI